VMQTVSPSKAQEVSIALEPAAQRIESPDVMRIL
jgi:hypothetical protein